MQFTHETNDGITNITISGEFDSLTAPEVRATFEEIAEKRPTRVVLDLMNLRLIDSSGVGAIVSLFKRVKAVDGKFEVVNLHGQPRSIFKVLRLDKVFNIGT